MFLHPSHPIWICVTTLSLCLVQVSIAQTEDAKAPVLKKAERERAKKDFMAGRAAFEQGNYKAAIKDFSNAYEVTRSPEILYNIGRCHEELKQYDEAIRHYEMYLVDYPKATDAKERISALRARISASAAEGAGGGGRDEGEPSQDDAHAEVDENIKSSESETGDEAAWWRGVRLGLDIGVLGGLTGPTSGVVVPLSLSAHYPLRDWLLLGVNFAYGAYFSKDDPTGVNRYETKSQFGFAGGAKGHWSITKTIEFISRLELGIYGLSFRGSHVLAWLTIKGLVGVDYALRDDFRLLGGVTTMAGPVFAKDQAPDQLTDPGPEVELGALLGAEYIF